MSRASQLLTGAFWLATFERAIKTAGQTGVALWGTGATGILEVDMTQGLSVVGLATLVSVCTSLGSLTVGTNGPSLARESLPPVPAPDRVIQTQESAVQTPEPVDQAERVLQQ